MRKTTTIGVVRVQSVNRALLRPEEGSCLMRSFNLGSDVHEVDIQASFKHGVLKLQAPKLVEEVV